MVLNKFFKKLNLFSFPPKLNWKGAQGSTEEAEQKSSGVQDRAGTSKQRSNDLSAQVGLVDQSLPELQNSLFNVNRQLETVEDYKNRTIDSVKTVSAGLGKIPKSNRKDSYRLAIRFGGETLENGKRHHDTITGNYESVQQIWMCMTFWNWIESDSSLLKLKASKPKWRTTPAGCINWRSPPKRWTRWPAIWRTRSTKVSSTSTPMWRTCSASRRTGWKSCVKRGPTSRRSWPNCARRRRWLGTRPIASVLASL